MDIEIQIKERIVNRFKPTVKTIEKQTINGKIKMVLHILDVRNVDI